MFLRSAFQFVNRSISKKSMEVVRNFSTTQALNIELKDKLPRGELFIAPGKPFDIGERFAKCRVVIVGVIGAFTPSCKDQTADYIKKSMVIKTNFCVDEIFLISVNDAYVMEAWAKDLNNNNKIKFLADPCGAYVTELDLTQDIPDLGGLRSKRFSLIAWDGAVTELNIEPDAETMEVSLAENLGHTLAEHLK